MRKKKQESLDALPIYSHPAQAIANPRLYKIKDNLIIASFEWMKVITVRYVIEEWFKEAKIKEGDTIVESSSGVYAYSLALVCHEYHLKCVIIGSPAIDKTLKCMLELLGATVYVIDAKSLKDSQLKRVSFLKQYLINNPSAHWIGQYHNRIHYKGYQLLAENLIKSIGKNFTLIAAVGTGCSACGTIAHLREHSDIPLIGVEPFGSVSFGLSGDAPIIAGIGTGILFPNVEQTAFDRIHWVNSDLAARSTVKLYKNTGIFGGHSSGAVYCVAEWEADQSPSTQFVCISADEGYRYIESVYQHSITSEESAKAMPIKVQHPNAVFPPWSYMNWERKPLSHYQETSKGSELWI